MSIIKWSGKIKCVALIVPISIMIVIILLLAKDTLKDNYEVIFADAFYCNSCYVTKKGELYFVGLNADNVYSESSIVTKPIKINTGQSIVKKAVCSLNSILYLDEKGDVYIVGSYKTQSGKSKQTDVPVKIEGLSNIVDIAAGEMHYMALNNDGIVWSWGKNECKQVSSKIASTEYWKPYKINIQDVQKIECGYYTSCVITKNNVILWGENSFQINANERFDDYYKLNIDNAKEVSIGRNHLIIQTDKDLIGYGSNYFNQLGNDESSLLQGEIIDIELEKIDAVSCGYTSSTFLSDGRMYLLGDIDPFDGDENTDFKLIEANRTFDQITSRGFHIIAYGRDGLIFRGNNNWGQCAENIRKNKRNSVSNMIALVDTGVYWAEELLDCRGDVDVRPENKSLCNLKQGNNQIFDDVYDDSHGTAMMGLMLDCKIKNGKILK